jgi:hypothetical protein
MRLKKPQSAAVAGRSPVPAESAHADYALDSTRYARGREISWYRLPAIKHADSASGKSAARSIRAICEVPCHAAADTPLRALCRYQGWPWRSVLTVSFPVCSIRFSRRPCVGRHRTHLAGHAQNAVTTCGSSTDSPRSSTGLRSSIAAWRGGSGSFCNSANADARCRAFHYWGAIEAANFAYVISFPATDRAGERVPITGHLRRQYGP